MSSNESGNGFNWKLMLAIGAPIAISLAAAVTIYVYYSRKKRGNGSSDLDTSEGSKKGKLTDPARQQTPETAALNEEEEAALKCLIEKKSQANMSFSSKDFERAAQLYTEILEESPDISALRPDLAKIYHNRAVTYDKLKGEGVSQKVIEDCTKAIFIDPKYCKARVRRAKAYESVGDVLSCFKDWTLVGLLDPQLAERDPAWQRVDSLVRDKAAMIVSEEMKTHVVILPSKVAVEDFLHLFNHLEIYEEKNLLDFYSEDRGIVVVTAKGKLDTTPSPSEPTENGISPLNENNIASADENNSISETNLGTESESNTSPADSTADTDLAVTNGSIQNGVDELDLQGELELEPFWQAITLIRNRQYTRIVELTTQAIDTGCKVFHPHALLLRSTFYLILCKNQEALQDVDRILKFSDISPQLRIDAHLRRACAMEGLEKYESALDEFEQALQIDPNNHSIYLVRSKFYSSDDRPEYEKALKDITKCLELKPDNNLAGRCYYALLRYKLASSTQSVADLEKAKRHLKETMKQFPNKSEPISLYIQIMIDVQELKEASQCLEKAIAMDPDNGLLHVYRAQCNMSMKGASMQNFEAADNPHMKEALKSALEELEYAIRIDSQCNVAMEVLSTMYSQIGETARALEYLDMAIKYTRTKQEMISLQTFKLMLSYQPEITAEIQSVGLAPSAMQNYLSKQY